MLIIFDFDGTLADTWQWLADELVRSVPRYGGRHITRTDLEDLRGLETAAIFEALAIDRHKLPLLVSELRERAGEVGHFPLFAAIPELLDHLHRCRHTLAVGSSNTEAVVRSSLGVRASYVQRYQCSTAVFGKAEALTALMQETGYGVRDTLAIGDESRDVSAAKEAGVDAIAVEWGFSKAALLRSIAHGRTVGSVQALREAIDSLAGSQVGTRRT